MRRWLAVFLLILLPLQLSWAVAATYCGHEADPAARHVGHHEHRHEGDDRSGGTSPGGIAVAAAIDLAGAAQSDAPSPAPTEPPMQAADTLSSAADKGAPQPPPCVDDDCGFCHLGHTQPVASTPLELPTLGAPVASAAAPEPWSSRGPDRRERPNWRAA